MVKYKYFINFDQLVTEEQVDKNEKSEIIENSPLFRYY